MNYFPDEIMKRNFILWIIVTHEGNYACLLNEDKELEFLFETETISIWSWKSGKVSCFLFFPVNSKGEERCEIASPYDMLLIKAWTLLFVRENGSVSRKGNCWPGDDSYVVLVFNSWTCHVQAESQDYIKRRQLQELAILNSSFREGSPGPTGSMSTLNTIGMKRAKRGCWVRGERS